MPLQIRRGTTSQRLSITPLVSELVYDTQQKLVYVGDGVTAGGIAIDQDSSPNFPLGDLRDVVLTTVAEDDILRYDGTDWVNSELSLNSLDAVTVTAPANNDIIKFNGTAWVNSGLSFSTLPGVNLNSPEVNQVLKFNGTSWSNENEDSSLIVSALDDLSNVEITAVANNQVLRWNGTAWENSNLLVNGDGNIVDSLSNIILDVNAGALTGSVFANDFELLVDSSTRRFLGDVRGSIRNDDNVVVLDHQTRTFFGDVRDGSIIGNDSSVVLDTETRTFFGDVRGSVFGDDSTVLIDGTNGEIVGNVNNLLITTERVDISIEGFDSTPLSITTSTNGGNACNVNFFASRTSVANPTVLVAGDSIIDLNSSGWDGVEYIPAAAIKLGVDKYTTAIGTGIVPGRIVFLTFNESGTTGASNAMTFNRFGNLGIGKDDPAQKLDVQGNGVFAGFVQFGSLDTTARNALSAANGMVIYNTTDNRFQGYQNGAWINLDDGTAA